MAADTRYSLLCTKYDFTRQKIFGKIFTCVDIRPISNLIEVFKEEKIIGILRHFFLLLVGMGWGTGNFAQNTQEIHKIFLKLTWGAKKSYQVPCKATAPGTLQRIPEARDPCITIETSEPSNRHEICQIFYTSIFSNF